MTEHLFTEKYKELRQTIRKFVEKEIKPYVEEWEAHEFPDEIFRRMGEMGFFGLKYPEKYGGLGLDFFASIVLTEEIAKAGCAGLAMAVNVQTEMATPPILEFGTEEQIQKFLIPAMKGQKIAALGITEPDAGSDVSGIKTKAVRDGDEWVINGSKIFITNGVRADFITLVAKTDTQKGHRGVSLFLVETDRPGFKVVRKLNKLGMRASDTAEILFDNVRVPAENLLGVEGNGFKQIMWELQGERLIGSASSVAGAEHCLELAIDYAKNRVQFKQPISQFQVIRHALAEIAAKIEAARQLTYYTAYRFSRGEYPVKEISMCKLLAGRVYFEAADTALQIHGGNGYMMDYPIQREWRDSRLKRIGGGTDEIQKEIIAKQLNL